MDPRLKYLHFGVATRDWTKIFLPDKRPNYGGVRFCSPRSVRNRAYFTIFTNLRPNLCSETTRRRWVSFSRLEKKKYFTLWTILWMRKHFRVQNLQLTMEAGVGLCRSGRYGWWDVCGRKRRAAEDYLIKYPLCLNDSIWIKLEICERNQKWRFWNKRSFLGSGNKLKYVLSSFGKEKIRIIPIEGFLHTHPALPQ